MFKYKGGHLHEFLDMNIVTRWCEPILLLPRSTDTTPLGFSLRVYVRDVVYKTPDFALLDKLACNSQLISLTIIYDHSVYVFCHLLVKTTAAIW